MISSSRLKGNYGRALGNVYANSTVKQMVAQEDSANLNSGTGPDCQLRIHFSKPKSQVHFLSLPSTHTLRRCSSDAPSQEGTFAFYVPFACRRQEERHKSAKKGCIPEGQTGGKVGRPC